MMGVPLIETKSLKLVLQSRDDVREMIEMMNPSEKAQLSAAWLAHFHASTSADPWTYGFVMLLRASDTFIGRCGFKGPPDADHMVEIAYGVAPDHQGNGYATEAATALTAYAFESGRVRLVRAHTLPEPSASTRVLAKCGFQQVGEVIDPEDGLVWRWEKYHQSASECGAPNA